MARAWLVTSRGIARKIKQTAQLSNKQINELSAEAKRECPNCYYVIDNSDVNIEWPGLPAGVKFDPSDLELIEHLEGKVGIGNSKPHIFIDEFISTLKEEEGICYTHPENLPGISKEGHCTHFFHKISNAYSNGPRKRRKINIEDRNSTSVEHVRWHKTGKTKPIIDNGIQKGWKKIMVLYKSAQRGCKSDKANWVMHQYHLGAEETEKDGDTVVSKIFYQLRKEKEKFESEIAEDEDDNTAVKAATVEPRTPMTNVPHPPRQEKGNQVVLAVQKAETMDDQHREEQTSPAGLKNYGMSVWCENEPRADEEFNQQLLCDEVLDPFPLEPSLDLGLDALMDEYFCAPQDLQISELAFGSQDSMSSWWHNHL